MENVHIYYAKPIVAYGPDATAARSSLLQKSKMVYPSGYQLTCVVPDKGRKMVVLVVVTLARTVILITG